MIDKNIKDLEEKINMYKRAYIVLLNTKDRQDFDDMHKRLDYLKSQRNIINNLEKRGKKVNV